MNLFLLLSLAIATSSFSPSTIMARSSSKSSSLQAASGIGNSRPRFGEVSTEPVATVKVSQKQRNAMKDVVIDPDYSLSWQIAALCPLIIWYHPCKYSFASTRFVSDTRCLSLDDNELMAAFLPLCSLLRRRFALFDRRLRWSFSSPFCNPSVGADKTCPVGLSEGQL